MTAGDTRPTQPLPDWTSAPPEPRRRRSAWPWIISFVVVAGLAVAAWFVAEWIARGIVERSIREQIITILALPADQPIDVTVTGPVLPQLIVGELDDVTVSSEDVTVGSLTGDITVTAQGIAIRGDAAADAASGSVRLDEDQLEAMLAGVEDFPVETVELDEPDVVISTELRFLGIAIPITVALTPAAAEGDIVLAPSTLRLANGEVTAEGLREQFGGLADAVLRDWTVCIAEYIPAGLTLTSIAVEGHQVVADFDVDGQIVSDTELQSNGTCA
jgi:hypothetical protein